MKKWWKTVAVFSLVCNAVLLFGIYSWSLVERNIEAVSGEGVVVSRHFRIAKSCVHPLRWRVSFEPRHYTTFVPVTVDFSLLGEPLESSSDDTLAWFRMLKAARTPVEN